RVTLAPTSDKRSIRRPEGWNMNEHEEIANALKARLSELRTHLAKVDRELHKRLPADSEDQAIELEDQEALEVVKKTETTEIRQVEAALKRISEGAYGTCAKCGEPIDPALAAAKGNWRRSAASLAVAEPPWPKTDRKPPTKIGRRTAISLAERPACPKPP